jgi:YbbR domain-containing protein
MRRVIGFIVHNWPLKLAAIALATLMYAGLVVSQGARVWPGPIPIQIVHQPTSAFVVGTLPDVTNVRYFAPADVADHLSSSAFAAYVDLTNAPSDASQPYLADVTLRAPSGVNVLDYTPQQIFIRLDPVVTRTVPVKVVHGTVPDGLTLGDTQTSQNSVTISGPQSVVTQVVSAEARVQIQSSGIDVDQLVDLVPVDGRDEVVTPVDLTPSTIRVRIPVGAPVTTKSVPVTAVVTGSPADGYVVANTTVDPLVATITGEANLLAGITSVNTQPVDIGGATSAVTKTVGLDLPDGITSVGNDSFAVGVQLRPSASTRNFTVGVVVVGGDPTRTYTLASDTVTVTLGGDDAALNAVDPTTFVGSVDVTGLDEGQHAVDVHVVAPAGLKLVAVSPTQITVFVSVAATPPPSPTPSPVETAPSASGTLDQSPLPGSSGGASPSGLALSSGSPAPPSASP